jgi:hypothetical protein
LYRYVKVDGPEGKAASHTRIKMSNGALDLAAFAAKKDEPSFWLSKSGAPLALLVFTFDLSVATSFGELKPLLVVRREQNRNTDHLLLNPRLQALRQTPQAHDTTVLVVGVKHDDTPVSSTIAEVSILQRRALIVLPNTTGGEGAWIPLRRGQRQRRLCCRQGASLCNRA